METRSIYRKYGILYVDDEIQSLKYFKLAFGDKFRIFTAQDADEGFQVLRENQHRIAIIMSDQRMPGEQGVQFLARAKNLNPQVCRILVTAYSDIDSAIDAINDGGIHKYVNKPWEIDNLESTIRHGFHDYITQKNHSDILHEKVLLLYRQVIADRQLNLGIVSSGFSHHLRNLLVTVKTFLDFIPIQLAKAGFDPKAANNTDYWVNLYGKAERDLTKIDNLLNRMCDLTATADCRFNDKVDLQTVIAETIRKRRDFLKSQQIEIINRITNDLPQLIVDNERFCQLFELLIEDELQYLPEEGRLIFAAHEISGDQNSDIHSVVITLKDNGKKIPSECVDSVFDPFFVRDNNPREHGVNLVTCYFIVHQHGGEIDVQNNDDQGVTFTITLPVDPRILAKQESFLQKMVMNEFFLESVVDK